MGTHNVFLKICCICVYVWELSAPYPQTLILNTASQRLNTFWWRVVPALSNMSDPWWEWRLCLFVTLLIHQHMFYMMWKDVGMLSDSFGRHISSGLNCSLRQGTSTKQNMTWVRLFFLFWIFHELYWNLEIPDAWTVQARGLGTLIFALFSLLAN